jgi:phosphoribosyl 1,2-cyclic phosphate phosphodiesterase
LEIDEEPFTINKTVITPLPVMHLRLPVLGFRIGDFSYITDANFISESTHEKLKGTKILVINALQREHHVSHFNLREAVEIVKIINPEKAYFTHISHRLGLHSAVEKELPENISLAFDGQVIDVNR